MGTRGLPFLTALLLATGLSSCGGETKTVTVGGAPAPPPAAATSPPAQTTPVDPATTSDAPPANLPAGAIAVQGRFTMTLLKETTSGWAYTGENLNEGDKRRWIADTTCDSTCHVRLRRELKSGSLETAVLDQDPDDPARYGSTKTIQESYCLGGHTAGPVTKRVSLKVTKTNEVDGKLVAARMDGYLAVKQRCRLTKDDDPIASTAVVQFRGSAGQG